MGNTEDAGVELTDEELVERVQRGQAEEFGVLYRRHAGRIGRFLRTVGVPPADAEDLTAETFCRALDKIDQYETRRGRRYLSYLYSIARNLATDRIRYQPRVLSFEELEHGSEPSDGCHEESIVDSIRQLEQVAQIRDAMRRLPVQDREILMLAYDRELSCREIMELLGKPSITAVTSHVYGAMKKLRKLVAEASTDVVAR